MITLIKDLVSKYEDHLEKSVEVAGWIYAKRGNKNIYFLEINDGSCFQNVQVVCKKASVNLAEIDVLPLGSSLVVQGVIQRSIKEQQPFELIASKISVIRKTTNDYPLQKKDASRRFLREIPHFRHRTNLLRAIMRIRSTLALEIHNFFHQNNFIYLASPILTSNDGEGAGEAFTVALEDGANFFNRKATLGVTGQLQAESYANGFGRVYTFAPIFRAEKSHTQKHLAEFWMVEPEVCFYNLEQIIVLCEDMLKFAIKKVLTNHKSELEYLQTCTIPNLITRLETFVDAKVKVITYADAIEILKNADFPFENKDIYFGIDLKTEHEKYLVDKYFEKPVVIVNYPKEIKAFYMYQNSDNKTVKAFDFLIPGIGELVGGSQREDRFDELVKRMNEMGIPRDDLQWYLEIKKEGYPGSSGFGLGFERLVMYVTGIENIRDVIPYPRTHNNLFA